MSVRGEFGATPVSDASLSLIIADDHKLMRDGLRMVVGVMLPAASVFEANDGISLWQIARFVQYPALALVDLNMPEMERGNRLGLLAHDFPRLPVVVVSALTSPDVQRRVLDIPTVFAFVPKSGDSQLMREAICAALAGRRMTPAVAPTSEPPPDAALTPRMQEIRSLLRQGLSNKHIAQKLNISEGPVKNYMTDIFRLLSVTNRTQAAQYDAEST